MEAVPKLLDELAPLLGISDREIKDADEVVKCFVKYLKIPVKINSSTLQTFPISKLQRQEIGKIYYMPTILSSSIIEFMDVEDTILSESEKLVYTLTMNIKKSDHPLIDESITGLGSNNSQYSAEMREQTAKFIIQNGKSSTGVAEEMGIDTNTVCWWMREYRRDHKLPSYVKAKVR